MTSFREERLQEQVAEIRPQLAKACEIAEKAESENRASIGWKRAFCSLLADYTILFVTVAGSEERARQVLAMAALDASLHEAGDD